jgi:hypothetical protein
MSLSLVLAQKHRNRTYCRIDEPDRTLPCRNTRIVDCGNDGRKDGRGGRRPAAKRHSSTFDNNYRESEREFQYATRDVKR